MDGAGDGNPTTEVQPRPGDGVASYASCVESVVARYGYRFDLFFADRFKRCRHKYFSKWNMFQSASYADSTCIGNRFTDNADGTVTDHLSGLVWEKKTDDDSVHDKDNSYTLSTGLRTARTARRSPVCWIR